MAEPLYYYYGTSQQLYRTKFTLFLKEDKRNIGELLIKSAVTEEVIVELITQFLAMEGHAPASQFVFKCMLTMKLIELWNSAAESSLHSS